MSRVTANLLLLFAGAVWGMGFVAQSTAMEKIGPWSYNGLRFLVGGLALLPLVRLEALRAAAPLSGRQWHGYVAIGLFLFAGSILQQIGMVHTSVTNAGFLTGLYVVLTPLLALALFGNRPHPVILMAAPMAFVGIVLTGGGHLGPLSGGDMLILAGAVFWALQILFIGRFAPGAGRPFALSATQFLAAAGLSSIGALFLEDTGLSEIAAAAPEILYAGLVSVALGFTVQVVAQQHTTGPQAAVMLSSETLFAGLFGALILGERLGPVALAGCGLIFAAMLLVEVGPAAWQARRRRGN